MLVRVPWGITPSPTRERHALSLRTRSGPVRDVGVGARAPRPCDSGRTARVSGGCAWDDVRPESLHVRGSPEVLHELFEVFLLVHQAERVVGALVDQVRRRGELCNRDATVAERQL